MTDADPKTRPTKRHARRPACSPAAFGPECDHICRELVENAPIGIFRSTPQGGLLNGNQALADLAGYASPAEMVTRIKNLARESYADPGQREDVLQAALANGGRTSREVELKRKDGSRISIRLHLRLVFNPDGGVACWEGFAEDITPQKEVEQSLMEHRAKLARTVHERTVELRERTSELEEMNRALRALLGQLDQEGARLRAEVARHISESVQPYLERLALSVEGEADRECLRLAQRNLDQLHSEVARPAPGLLAGLTTVELQVAAFVKEGLPTKAIAELMRVAPRTVETHRNRIRRKLNLRGQNVSLRAALLALDKNP